MAEKSESEQMEVEDQNSRKAKVKVAWQGRNSIFMIEFYSKDSTLALKVGWKKWKSEKGKWKANMNNIEESESENLKRKCES